MVQLPPSQFTYGKYGNDVIPFDIILSKISFSIGDNSYFVKWLLTQNIIGYCNSMECEIRPRKNEMAVMFEDDENWQGWSHVPTDIWKEYLKQLKIGRGI